ncbi:MLP-like protein 43 [Vigna unguiculata]|uniref:MLP-like protein 43 n=1 Tax=Vigna unguiculata TaxID=3917 RepID=UPI001015ED1F|nr:MLP-like protein 43 [Vigna unguiculata]
MTLAGKITSEIGVHATAAKWFNLFSTQLHHVQNLSDRVHGTKLHRGEDWHHTDSIKHWTYTIEGKVTTCLESIECVDEANKRITYKLFDGDLDPQFKLFKFVFQTIHKNSGGAIIIWTVEYERVSEEVDPPYGYVEYLHTFTRHIDAHLRIA